MFEHCQRHHGPKAFIKSLNVTIECFKSINELHNLGKTSAWFYLAKGEKNITFKNPCYNNHNKPCNNFDKPNNSIQYYSMSWQNFSPVLFGKGQEMHVTTLTNPYKNFDKSNNSIRHYQGEVA